MASRRVLITGASKGIGRAVADRLAADGYVPTGLARTAPTDFPGQLHQIDQPPQRLLLGSDALAAAITKSQDQIAEAKRWAELSRSTDFATDL